MEGVGRRGVLGIESPDPILSLIASLGLGAAAGTALVIDVTRDCNVGTKRTLADLLEDGPSLGELSPTRTGVAMIGSGPAGLDEALPMIDRLAVNWPAVVIRCDRGGWPGPTVPVRPLWPGLIAPNDPFPAVWQSIAGGIRPPGPGPILPRLSARRARDLLAGRLPGRGRWVRVWDLVWRMPWA